MSKFKEFLSLIPKAIPNAHKIVNAIKNNVLLEYGALSEDKKYEIIRRRVICATCPFMSTNAVVSKEYKSLHGEHYTSHRIEPHCSFCGCPTKIRTAALDKECGISTYNEDHKENPLPLKWDKYEK